MADIQTAKALLDQFPRVSAGHYPTAIEPLENLGATLGLKLYVKRDDCTGFAFGGNKVRQLEYYFGAAKAENADTVLITGAVQSNFVRMAAAFAARFGMECHIQLEERVPAVGDLYRNNGNVLLDRLLGAALYSYPVGEDEAGADAAISRLAKKLKAAGKRPYIIPLGTEHAPLGALGYVGAALELAYQLPELAQLDAIVIASGSALSHVGLLFGLRLLGLNIPVYGICVRRDAAAQTRRIRQRLNDLAKLLSRPNPVPGKDILLFDDTLKPGYGVMSPQVKKAITQAARLEGIFLDPVYSGKAMAGLTRLAGQGELAGKTVLFWHTGGTPALFAYADQLE